MSHNRGRLLELPPYDDIQMRKHVVQPFKNRRIGGRNLHNLLHKATLLALVLVRVLLELFSKLLESLGDEEDARLVGREFDVLLGFRDFFAILSNNFKKEEKKRELQTFFVTRKQYPYVALFSK